MATIRNPINDSKYIDLLPAIANFQPSYGLIADSGLFTETPVKSNVAMFEIEDTPNAKMTKLTSRTERDAVKVGRGTSKWVTTRGVTLKVTGGVHVEDLQNQLTTFNIDEDKTLQEALVKRTEDLYNSFSQSYEYLLLGATEGVIRDPYDGTVKVNMFTETGTARPTATIDVRANGDVIGGLNALRNQINLLNGWNGNVNQIRIMVTDAVFNLIVTHPDLQALYTLAYQGRGQEALMQRILNGTANVPTKTNYGWTREFTWENIVISTYPQQFVRMDGTAVDAVQPNKGWTIVTGTTNSYEVLFAPAPYFSQMNVLGQKLYARSTGIVDDTHLDITMESHLNPLMKRPELSVDITFTVA